MCVCDVCEIRDTKGMYKKARQGEINDFTGIDSPYEKPSSPDLILNTQSETINECLGKIIIITNYQ